MITRLSRRLCDWALERFEARQRAFFTYHLRPSTADAILNPEGQAELNHHLSVVIQGPVVEKHDFTLQTIALYKKHFPGASIILSTWSDCSDDALRRCDQLGVYALRSEKPSYAGTSNINYQLVSSRKGIELAQSLGADYVLKTRTDQRLYAPNVAEYLYNLSELFPATGPKLRQNKRIIGTSLDSFKFRMYGMTDMLLYGTAEDMQLYWSADLDSRRFTDEQIRDAIASIGNWARWRVCEVYLATEFLKKVGHELRWTLEDSWTAFRHHFCIVDHEQLDLYWPKYSRQEHRWRNYHCPATAELNFREWLNIYSNSCVKEIPEHYVDAA